MTRWIIPDVHGRTFWRSAVESAPEGTRFVFLGDYLDPYPWEEIYPEDATVMLAEIIALGDETLTAKLNAKREADAAKVLSKDADIASRL